MSRENSKTLGHGVEVESHNVELMNTMKPLTSNSPHKHANLNDGAAHQTPLGSWERWFLLGLILSAFMIRLTYLLEIRENPFFTHPRLDALFHDKWAESIAAGDLVGDEVFFRAPAYPYFLGGLYAIFGHNYFVPRIVQHLIGVLSLVVLYFFVRRLCGSAAAVIASALASLYAVLVYFEGELLFDSLLMFSCLVWLLLVERSKEHPTPFNWLAVGVVYGVVCCIRPPFLAIAPFLFALLVWQQLRSGAPRAAAKTFALITLGCTFPILPITIRNYAVGHDLVLIASQGGVNFYIGNNADADGYSSMMPGRLGTSWDNRDATYMVEKALGHPPTSSEVSWFWYKKGLSFVVDEPIQYMQLILKKAYLFWNWYEIPNNQSFYSFTQYSQLLQILPVGFWCAGPIGLLGMVIALRRKHMLFHVAFVMLYSGVTIIFFVCDRFRLPIILPLCMFAGYAMISLYDRMRSKHWGWLARAGCFALCSALFVNSSLYAINKDSGARDFLSLGIVELNKRHYDTAITFFAQAAEHAAIPRPNLYLNWGVAEWERGNTQNAILKFHQELFVYPDSHGALSNLSHIYLGMGRADSAIWYGKRAIEARPYLPKPYIAVAQAYQEHNQLDSAVAVLERGLHSCDRDFLYGKSRLAWIFNFQGKTDSSEKYFKSVLEYHARPEQPSFEPDEDFSASEVMDVDKDALFSGALYGLGQLWVGRHNLDSAAFYFRMATVQRPHYGNAWANLGVALMQTRRYAAADSAFSKAIELQPANHLYWYNYGTLLGMSGRLTQARDAFTKCLSLQPDFEPARRSMAVTAELMKNINRNGRNR